MYLENVLCNFRRFITFEKFSCFCTQCKFSIEYQVSGSTCHCVLDFKGFVFWLKRCKYRQGTLNRKYLRINCQFEGIFADYCNAWYAIWKHRIAIFQSLIKETKRYIDYISLYIGFQIYSRIFDI